MNDAPTKPAFTFVRVDDWARTPPEQYFTGNRKIAAHDLYRAVIRKENRAELKQAKGGA